MASRESWSSILQCIRKRLREGNFALHDLGESLERIGSQISEYNTYIATRCGASLSPLSDRDKFLIEETRACLRFGICCFSCDDDGIRKNIQDLLVESQQVHHRLTTMLSYERGDSKCRLLAAKLFCNLATSNTNTATTITNTIRLSPSSNEISSALQKHLTQELENSPPDHWQEPSWTTMIVSSTRGSDREVLAAIVAALYNCTVALSWQDLVSFATLVSSNSMLVSTLLRQMISVHVVKHSIQDKQNSSNDAENVDAWDSATDWILLLLSKLLRVGMLPLLFWSITSEGPPSSLTISPKAIYPEHNVLLHCAAHEAQSFMDHASTESQQGTNPFGGDVGWEQLRTSYEFLVDLFGKPQERSTTVDDMDSELVRSAALLSVDVLAISLGVDHPDSTKLRDHLGSNTPLVTTACFMLGTIVDQLNERTNGTKARELKISSDEQQWLVSLVRLIGNLCYECKPNQDRVRMTCVPVRKSPGSSDLDFSRNGLHVLLSCTTFGVACFTLREWVVMAIRNILHENQENQTIVAALDAQDTVQSVELKQAGVRFTMDKGGKVSLSTLNEEE